MHPLVVTTLGVLLAFAIRGLFWAAIENTMIWATQRFGLCRRCGESATHEFHYESVSVLLCRKCARETLGSLHDEAVRRGILRKHEIDG